MEAADTRGIYINLQVPLLRRTHLELLRKSGCINSNTEETFSLGKFQRREQTPLWKQFTATTSFVAPTKYKSSSTQEGVENPQSKDQDPQRLGGRVKKTDTLFLKVMRAIFLHSDYHKSPKVESDKTAEKIKKI